MGPTLGLGFQFSPLLGSLKAAELLLAPGAALGSALLALLCCFNAAVPQLGGMRGWLGWDGSSLGSPGAGRGGTAAPWGYQGLVMDRLTCLTVNWNRV